MDCVRCAFLSFLFASTSRQGCQHEHSADALQCLHRPRFPGAEQYVIARGDGHAILFLSLQRPALGFERGEVREPCFSERLPSLDRNKSRHDPCPFPLFLCSRRASPAFHLFLLALTPTSLSLVALLTRIFTAWRSNTQSSQTRGVSLVRPASPSLPSIPLLSSLRPKNGRGLDAQ
jgi:hypothetical protein